MTAKRNTTKRKMRAVSVIACVALVLCAVLSFAFVNINRKTASANDAAPSDIRFVQVAAGEDFAIGLTYNGDLYGWSLIGNTTKPAVNNELISSTTTSLGNYYTNVPTRIENPVSASHGTIKQIAATRSTAALLTTTGYIYTWGQDTDKFKDIEVGNDPEHLLLLRTPTTTMGGSGGAYWFVPGVVNYRGFYLTNNYSGLHLIEPGRAFANTGMSQATIAASEYNYIVVFKNYDDKWCSYVWGSLLYTNVNIQVTPRSDHSYIYDGNTGSSETNIRGGEIRAVYQTAYSGTITAVAGGYNVGMNGSAGTGGTSLTLRGRNFLTSVDMPADVKGKSLNDAYESNSLKPVYYTNTVNTSGAIGEGKTDTSNIYFTYKKDSTANEEPYTVNNAILGGRTSRSEKTLYQPSITGSTVGTSAPDTATYKWYANDNDDEYYARQKGTQSYTTGGTPYITNASGVRLDTEGNAKVINNAVSLGNGVGYGIYGGSLLAWGDNTIGQLALDSSKTEKHYASPEAVVSGGGGLSGTIVSVAAGKQLSSPKNSETQYRAFNSREKTIKFLLNNNNTVVNDKIEFTDDVQNQKEYITGALNSTGQLFLWGNVNGLTAPKTPTEVFYSGNSAKSEASGFVAVYSGYGNHIFAITKLGKVVHYTLDKDGKFNGEIYDKFAYGANSTELTNWAVGNDSAGRTGNNITFSVDGTGEPALGSFTAFLDYGYADKNSVLLNGSTHTNFASADVHTPTLGNEYCDTQKDGENDHPDYNRLSYTRGNFVTANAIGDAYRILTYDLNDQGITFTNTTGTEKDVRTLSKAELTPKFYLGSSTQPMSDRQRSNMFDWGFVYNTVPQNGDTPAYTRIGIKISPKQSSKENVIRVEFLVARYDRYGNYKSTSAEIADDKAVYYDYKKASFEFKINNTYAYRAIEAFQKDANDAYKGTGAYPGTETGVTITGDNIEQSYLPLLDPLSVDNNRKGINNQYSVALMDVTTGVHRLAEYLQGMNENALGEDPHNQNSADYDSNALVKAIHLSMKENDSGYPDINKIEAGNLDYYLRNATSAYNDKYKFMFKDRDGDLLKIDDFSEQGVTSGVKASRVEIPVSVDISGYVITGDNDVYNTDGTLNITNLYRDFNNLYGFYDFAVSNDSDGKQRLSFKYDVLRLTATGSTGGLRYYTEKVNDYNTTSSGSYLRVSIYAREFYQINDGSKATPYRPDSEVSRRQTSNGNVAAAFSQSTLRATVDKVVYMGDHNRNNAAETTIGSGLAVGKTTTIKLDDYVAGSSSSSDIRFSYNGATTTAAFDSFNSLFVDSIGGDTYNTVRLRRDSALGDIIEITPVSTHNIYFTIGIQRFINSSSGSTPFDDGDEKISLSFSFTNIEDVDLAVISGVQDNPVYISTDTTFDLFTNGIVTLNERYRNNVVISQLSSSDSKILKVTPVEGSNTSFKAEPQSSGKVSIQFIATVYGKSVFVSLNKVNVSGVTEISDSIELIDTQYVYVNTMLNELQRTNSFNEDIAHFGILYSDSFTRPATEGYSRGGETVHRAVYFTESDGTSLDSDEYPSFVKSVKFVDIDTDNPRMRIELDSEATETFGSFMLHVRYVDTTKGYTTYEQAEAANAAILETSELIRSSKQIVKNESGGPLEIVIDCDNPKARSETTENSDWYTDGKDDDFRAYIPIRYLLSSVGIKNPEEYKIFLVTSTEDAADYFNYSSNNEGTRVIINPLYNTDSAVSVNVSVRPITSSSTSSNQVLSFRVSVTGISTTLTLKEYRTIWLVAFFASFGVLLIIFIIRLAVYWKRRARQRQLIKRNQELIRMRDRVHNKSTAATREQIVKTKMKMEDPRYAKMLTDMRKEQRAANAQGGVDSLGITLESMSQPAGISLDDDKGKKKKKKGGKKSIAELKAELEAKKAAFAQAQTGVPVDAPQDAGFGAPPVDSFAAETLNVDTIVFDAPDIDGGTM